VDAKLYDSIQEARCNLSYFLRLANVERCMRVRSLR